MSERPLDADDDWAAIFAAVPEDMPAIEPVFVDGWWLGLVILFWASALSFGLGFWLGHAR